VDQMDPDSLLLSTWDSELHRLLAISK